MPKPLKPLRGVRIVSVALNLPGPAALMRLHSLGARCTKLEGPSGDPMAHYLPAAYAILHSGVKTVQADLKTPAGQAKVHKLLASADVLLTSFRPSALAKLGLGRQALAHQHPHLSVVSIVGSPGVRAEEPGHDLTYLAQHGLVTGLDLPATLYADMAGSLLAVEAVLSAVLSSVLGAVSAKANAKPKANGKPKGSWQEVALADAAQYLALPRNWGLTQPTGSVGGAHAGYRLYPCQDGRVAVAALEPHFAKALCLAAGVAHHAPPDMLLARTHTALAQFFATQTCKQLTKLAAQKDIPLLCLA